MKHTQKLISIRYLSAGWKKNIPITVKVRLSNEFNCVRNVFDAVMGSIAEKKGSSRDMDYFFDALRYQVLGTKKL